MKKIKWNNIALLIIAILSTSVVLHDIYMLTISSFTTGYLATFTWFGLATFILALIISINAIITIIEKLDTKKELSQQAQMYE